jgi:ankyrin repeat protein
MFYEARKCDEAWKDVRQAQDLGAQVHPGFLEALGQQCPPKSAESQGEMSPQEAIQRLKEYWHSEATEAHFGMSVVQGQKEAVELFLAAGLSVNSKHMGDPVLCHAIGSFQYDIALMLIEKGADVNAADSNGNPPLVLAVGQCGIPQLPKGATKEDLNQLVQALIDAGADIHATFLSGHTVYEMAGISKCPEIQETLRKAGAK